MLIEYYMYDAVLHLHIVTTSYDVQMKHCIIFL